jgi:Tfp pilus assembly protein FimT
MSGRQDIRSARRHCVRPDAVATQTTEPAASTVPCRALSHPPSGTGAHARCALRSCRLRVFARRALRSESGLSLMELVVGLTIMAIFMAIFTASVSMMYNTTSKTEALSDTASQLSIAFNRLDTSVRYASAISAPGQSGSDWYVEWQSTYTGSATCTQVRVDATKGQLQQRSWTPATDGSATGLTVWLPLASGLQLTDPDSGAAVTPFTVTAVGTAIPYQQLSFHLIAEATGRAGVTTTVTSVTFTAFNSGNATAGTVCGEAGRS